MTAFRYTGRLRRSRRTWAGLSSFERLKVAQAVVLLPTVAVANRIFGFMRVQLLLAATTHEPRSDHGTLGVDEVATVVAMVEIAAHRGVFRANCLHRSMVTWWILRRRGVDTIIRFGVRPSAGGQRPDFHAWVERDGLVLNDHPKIADEFFPFDGPVGRSSWS